jgi:hypothetical protein
MRRRSFLKISAAAVAAGSLPWRSASATADWQTYDVTTKVTILKPKGASRAWVPLPLLDDTEWHRAIGNSWSGNAAKVQVHTDGKYGASILLAEWKEGEEAPVVEVTSRFMTRDRATDFSRPNAAVPRLSAADYAFYTSATELIPTDGIVRDTARDIVKGVRSDVDKARAIYEWVVENTFRDPKTRGCGWGDIKTMLETKNFGGKCGDLNAMFVGLSRSAGVPARDVYGLRVAPSIHGIPQPRRRRAADHQGAALPRGVLCARVRLDSGRPGGRAQSRSGRAAGQSSGERCESRSRTQATVRRMGDELARLQHGP